MKRYLRGRSRFVTKYAGSMLQDYMHLHCSPPGTVYYCEATERNICEPSEATVGLIILTLRDADLLKFETDVLLTGTDV